MSVHGNGKDSREWVIKDRGTGKVLISGYPNYAEAKAAARLFDNAEAVTA